MKRGNTNTRRLWGLALLSFGLATALFAGMPGAAGYSFKLREIRTDEQYTLDKLTEGKALIFHVWSPECPHCQRHMPYVAALSKKVDPETVNFYMCSMESDTGEAVDYLDGKKLELPCFCGPCGSLSDAFTNNGWPTSFVFAPGGKFIGWCDTQSPAYVNEMLELVDTALAEQ